MNRIQYRSKGLAMGAFSSLGNIHVHIDGADSQERVRDIVIELEKGGNPGTLDHIIYSAAGPQRKVLPETYESHTPVLGGEEAFDFFSSTDAKDRSDAIRVINRIGEMLAKTPGVIIEAEQNIGWLDGSGWHCIAETSQLALFQPGEVNLLLKPSLKHEIHHGFDIPKTGPMISLPKLMRFCKNNNIVVGGWFVFDDGDNWGCWSNSFMEGLEIRSCASAENLSLIAFLSAEGFNVRPVTLVERVLGIFHTK